MGQEIADSRFTAADFAEFQHRLDRETVLLSTWLEAGGLRSDQPVGGFELEAWLIGPQGHPAPINEAFLQGLGHPLVVPELSTFNVELNTPPTPLGPGAFAAMHRELAALWRACELEAARHSARMLMIGILPTVSQDDLSLANMSSLQRYRALNEQVFRLRGGAPLRLDIHGHDHLQLEHRDVMLEAATTSFQIHLKVDAGQAARAFNCAKMLSAPMVALAANSPYLFGHDLWAETRIPLFEQAVAVGGSDYSKRVTFGIRYAQDSILECFEANRSRYPVLLPTLLDTPLEQLAHLRLHNGTIWRWNRPLIGFDADGRPHIRIEHRVAPSGPSPRDLVANAAFYFGAMAALLARPTPPEELLPFAAARSNFYAAARAGLTGPARWDGRVGPLDQLCLQQLLPLARQGLERLGVTADESNRWLNLVQARIASGRTGAAWQRTWVARHGADFAGLVQAYRQGQQSDRPVHEWES